MTEPITKESCCAQNDGLLTLEGTAGPETALEKPSKRDISQQTPRENTFLLPVVTALGARMNLRDNRALEQPRKILNAIAATAKTEPWWICVSTLSSYVDWIYTHSIDVAVISLMLASEMGYSQKELWDIGVGAFLHDLGKLLIPTTILQKTGPLSSMEMTYLRQHCELGVSSLAHFGLPKDCTDIILQHHERLDGSGYPKGLKGDAICRNAKIVMIADVVDAIISGRPYRPFQGMDKALGVLRNDSEKYSQEYVSVLEQILKRC